MKRKPKTDERKPAPNTKQDRNFSDRRQQPEETKIANENQKPETKNDRPKNFEKNNIDDKKSSELRSEKGFYAFIDAQNLFWGGRKSIGFNIDYSKLKSYLEKKFGVTKLFYYAGVRTFDFEYSILDKAPLNLEKLEAYVADLKAKAEPDNNEPYDRTLDKIKFLRKIEEFGYTLKIKPAKVHYDELDEAREHPILKANCDVDMTFDMMRYMQQYKGLVAMTGDGDFATVINYLKNHDREVYLLSRWHRTARELKDIVGKEFIDIENLRRFIQF